MPKKEKVTELKNVHVNEISLVKRGAVQGSRFVICKRDDSEPDSPIVELTKTISSSEAWDTEYALRLLSEVAGLLTSLHHCCDRLPDEMKSHLKAIAGIFGITDEIKDPELEKSDDEAPETPAETVTETPVEPVADPDPVDPAPEVVSDTTEEAEQETVATTDETTESTVAEESVTEAEEQESPPDPIAEAEELLRSRNQEKVKTEADAVLEALESLTGVVTSLREANDKRFAAVDSRLNGVLGT